MKNKEHYLHFEEKTAYEHLKEARKKGQMASESVHGAEPSGSLIAACDAAKETVLYLAFVFLSIKLFNLPIKASFFILVGFSTFLIFWKTARSAIFGWARLERVHRLILQEKWEIEHHRAQEKEELLELYKAKGFKDHQLEEVVEVLMADDNRLLQVMLEEELGLSLGSFEHPLKQCFGAFLGVLVAAALFVITAFFGPYYLPFIIMTFVLVISSYLTAKTLNNALIKHITWNLASAFLALGVVYYLFESLIILSKRA